MRKFANQSYKNMDALIAKALSKSHTYKEYRALVFDLFQKNQTTGGDTSEALLHYTALNETRMNRLEKTLSIAAGAAERIALLERETLWLVLSEGWCGDAAQILPIIEKMAALSNKIEFRIALRDENLQLMDQFLTNGGRSIPKLMVIDKASGQMIGDWGPRPSVAAKLVIDYKAAHGLLDDTIKKELQLWYLHDKGISTQREILEVSAV